MASRTLVLRGGGYAVEEVHSLDKAITLVEADSIDATLICHTVARPERHLLVAVIREKRRLMPVLCIRSYVYEETPRTCIAVDNEPANLLGAIRLAIKQPESAV